MFAGGMLLVKLDSSDLQMEKMSPFEGTLVYAQNKRQQVVLTDHWSKQIPPVQFTTMHPGDYRFHCCFIEGLLILDIQTNKRLTF